MNLSYALELFPELVCFSDKAAQTTTAATALLCFNMPHCLSTGVSYTLAIEDDDLYHRRQNMEGAIAIAASMVVDVIGP